MSISINPCCHSVSFSQITYNLSCTVDYDYSTMALYKFTYLLTYTYCGYIVTAAVVHLDHDTSGKHITAVLYFDESVPSVVARWLSG